MKSVQDQALLRMAARLAKLSGWVLSATDRVLTWSDETAVFHEQQPGFSPTSLAAGLLHHAHEYRQEFQQALEACVETGAPFDLELQVLTANGRRVWVRAIGEAQRNASGQITHVQGAYQDISERKGSAEQILSLNVLLRETRGTLSDAFFTLDRDWRFTYVNRKAERLLERGREQLLGRNIWEEFKEAVGSESDREYHRALAERVSVHFDQFFPSLDRWFGVEAHVTSEGLAVYLRDMTERHKGQERDLAQVEGRYRGLLEAAPDAMLVVNSSGVIVILNLRAKKQFGYSPGELVGQPVTRIIPEGFAERLIADGTRTAAQALAQQIGTGLELVGRRKDGTEFPIEIMLSPLQSDEGILVTAAIRDISVRKAAERHLARMEGRYRGLLEAAPDAMLLVNPAGEIALVNLQAEKQFGYRRDELVGQQVASIIVEGFSERLITNTLDAAWAASTQPSASGLELTGRQKNGSEFPIELMLSPLPSTEGVLLAVAIRDITARKKAEALLLLKVKELNRSNEELGQFAYIASHDLQEPLRMVASYTQLLSRRYTGRLDSDADEFIAFAVDGANRMQCLIQDLLTYSRVGTSGAELLATSSEQALEVALLNLRGSIDDSGALVTHDALPTVLADRSQLVQLFQNLVGNAIKYQNPGVPRVHISTVKSLDKRWTFSVQDNGLGIDSKYFEKIFGMFQRLHKRTEFAGTGIGLAICKRIVERHGGAISVASELGQGSTFRFALAPSEMSS